MSNRPVADAVAERFETAEGDHPDPPDPPGAWEGGEATATDAGVVGRQWVEPERGLRVSYNLDDLTVSTERVEWDADRELWRFTGLAAPERHDSYDSDRAAMVAALELLTDFERGEILD